MLSRENRLIKEKDFETVFKKGVSLDEKIVFVKLLKNKLDFSRFGFVVSRKVSNKAVDRNKVKRKLREIIRLKINQIRPGFDLIIIANPAIIGKSYQEIREAIERILQKYKVLK